MVLAHSQMEQCLWVETRPDQSHHYLLQLTLQSAGVAQIEDAIAKNFHSVAAWAFVQSRPFWYIVGHTGMP